MVNKEIKFLILMYQEFWLSSSATNCQFSSCGSQQYCIHISGCGKVGMRIERRETMGGYGGSWQKEFYLECILTDGYTDSMYRWEAV